jgi:tetratricopeptide (TPR) repeat protein
LNFVLALLLLLAQPSDALLFARARAYTENGQFQQAIELWQEMTERHPDRVDAWAYLALAFRRQESFDLADRAVDHALEVDRESSRALWQRGLLRNLQQRPAEALDAFDLLQVKAAKQATFHYQRGVALQLLDRVEEATQAMRAAVDRDPELFAAQYSLYLLLRSDDPAAARAQLEQVEVLRDRQPDWVRNDQLRLEAGPLSDMDWPNAYLGLRAKGEGELYRLQLEGVRSRPDGVGAIVEFWTGDALLRRRYDEPPLSFRIRKGETIEVLRILWPNGMVQNVLGIDPTQLPDGTLRVREELFIKGSWGGVKIQD